MLKSHTCGELTLANVGQRVTLAAGSIAGATTAG